MPESDQPVYRAYVMGPDNHIRSAHMLGAVSDEEATSAARRLVDGHAIEVWERSRFVTRLEPDASKRKP